MANLTENQCKDFRQVERLPINTPLGWPHYSLRRYYIDEFYFRHVPSLEKNSLVLDLGGTKLLKRGQFDIEHYNLDVYYLNLLTDKRPDVQGDAAYIPFNNMCFDAVICAEVLELVPDPVRVLHEAFRILNSGGILLVCIPFLYRIQGHPYDYGRYTNSWWEENLRKIGFTNITIEWQGFFASVAVDMIRDIIEHKGGVPSRMGRKVVKQGGKWFLKWACPKALEWDERAAKRQDSFADWYCSYTGGFGIRAVKA